MAISIHASLFLLIFIQDECSFVSLRDVQRLLDVANWFYKQRRYLFPAIDDNDADELLLDEDEEEEMEPVIGQV